MARWLLGMPIAVLTLSFTSLGQNQPPSDPQAVTYTAESIAALTGGSPATDVTLTGNVTWTSGSQSVTGQGTFLAKGITESSVSLTSASVNRTDIRNNTGGTLLGEWIGSDGSPTLYALHNCMTDPGWFFPALSSLTNTDPTLVLAYIGPETKSGVSVQHIQGYHYAYSTTASSIALVQRLSTIDFYLNASSFLPVAITFNVHPDDDASTNLPIEVDFLSYQAINGFQVPMHVQQYTQGGLTLDFTVTSAVMNSGLPDTDFTIQ
jgi:hypothetical protein